MVRPAPPSYIEEGNNMTEAFVTEHDCEKQHKNLKWFLGIIFGLILTLVLFGVAQAVNSGTDNEVIKDIGTMKIEQAVIKEQYKNINDKIKDIKTIQQEILTELKAKNK